MLMVPSVWPAGIVIDVGPPGPLKSPLMVTVVPSGGADSVSRIVKMTVYVKAPEARAAVNTEWVVAFPDPSSRPARHTFQNDHLPANMLVQCDATAVLD